MTVWIISVVGVIVLTVLCDVMLPEGQTAKYIKTVISIVAIFVMISPIVQLVAGNLQLDQIYSNTQYEIDSEYLDYVYKIRIDNCVERCDKALEAKGYSGVSVELDCDNDKGNLFINKININIEKIVISGQNANIDIVVADIATTISTLLGIAIEKVNVYGKN